MTHETLSQMGIYQQLVDWYVRSGWLEPIDRGAFKKAGDQVSWIEALRYLQDDLKYAFHVGGQTALTMQGIQHFYNTKKIMTVWLFASKQHKKKLPGWFVSGDTYKKWGCDIRYLSPPLFAEDLTVPSLVMPQGSSALSSCTERALLEMLYLTPKMHSLEEAKYLMEGQMTLRPTVLQPLLESCSSVKTKRLFIFLADFCQLPCIKYLNFSEINLGKGKRMIGAGGHYIAKHQISIPKSFVNTFREEFDSDE